MYCAYDGPAKPVDDAGKKLLSKWCPNLLEEHNSNLCCDNEQVGTRITEFKKIMASIQCNNRNGFVSVHSVLSGSVWGQ